jgi:hypothetical protein
MDKFSFVVLLDYVSETVTDLFTFGLSIVQTESDLELGYFTVEGESESIQEFRSFLRGSTYI